MTVISKRERDRDTQRELYSLRTQSCVKVEVDVQDSPSLIVLMVSMDVK